MDEALKALLKLQTPKPKKEKPMATQGKWATIKSWFKIHPKVKAAFYGLGVVVLLNLQSNYDGTISLREAAWRTYGSVIVAVLAYLKSAR